MIFIAAALFASGCAMVGQQIALSLFSTLGNYDAWKRIDFLGDTPPERHAE